MKKILLVLISVFTFNYPALSQKPMAGKFSTEFLFYITAGNTINYINLYPARVNSGPVIKTRYYLANNLALRLTIGWTLKSSNTPIIDNNGSGLTGANKNNAYGYIILPGIEKHFGNSEKISPYLGIEAGFGQNISKITYENSINGSIVNTGYGQVQTSGAQSYNIDIVAGGDYYPVKHFYCGIEGGLVNQLYRTTEGKTTFTLPSGIPPRNEVDVPAANNFSSNFAIQGGIRIGFVF